MDTIHKRLPVCVCLWFIFSTTTVMSDWTYPDWIYPTHLCDSSHTLTSDFGPGPVFPQLPDRYSLRVETNIMTKNVSSELEEYRDGIKGVTSVRLRANGTTVHTIFDTTGRYDIYPNGSCTSRSFTDRLSYLSGSDKKQARQQIYALFQISERATDTRTYMGKDVVRGIAVDHWMACLKFAESFGHYQLDYYFSDEAHVTAAGVKQIPVRVVLSGSSNLLDTFGRPVPGTSNYFVHLYDFTSFRVGPAVNQDVFHVPLGVACTPTLVDKPMPTLPDTFELAIEVVTPNTDTPVQCRLIYDLKHGLVEARNSYVEQPQKKNTHANEKGYYTSVWVEDNKHRVTYIVNEVTMTCHAFKIPDADMKFRADSSVDLLQTASGKRKFYYKGQTIFRRMLVDAWTSELNGLVQEFYFLANSSGSPRNSTKWSERNRFRYPTPVGMLLKNNTATSSHQMSRIYAEFTRTATELTRELKKSGFLPTNETFQMGRKLIRTVSQLSTVYKLNFFHYSPILTSTEYFSVADCYKEAERLPLVVKVNNCSVREVFYNMKGFVNSLRRALADHSNLSIIQISEVALLTPPHLELSQRAKYIYLTLLGTPRVNDVQQLAIGPAKLALAHAIQKGIQFEVQYGNFSKVFRVSKELMEVNSTNFINIFFGPSNKTGQAYSTYRLGSRMFSKYRSPTKDNSRRYSPTAVAGVAFSMLTLGASLCLFVSIFLYKKRHPGQSLIALGETE